MQLSIRCIGIKSLDSGDSYSDVGYIPKPNVRPSKKSPLGVPYPGSTWAEDDKPNWVGYLVNDLTPGHDLVVYDYAIGGNRVDGVVNQIENRFISDIGTRPKWANWSSEDTLFGKGLVGCASEC